MRKLYWPTAPGLYWIDKQYSPVVAKAVFAGIMVEGLQDITCAGHYFFRQEFERNFGNTRFINVKEKNPYGTN